MLADADGKWLTGIAQTIESHRKMIDATIAQLTDAELQRRPGPTINSVAVIMRHIGGNLRSRWTDYLTTDGEKPDRDRDSEFRDWDGDRDSLISHLDAGWEALTTAVGEMNDETLSQPVFIRGEQHTMQQALLRSVAHLTYHVGQIALVARLVHDGDWRWLTIPPGGSVCHNEQTWGTARSRSVFGSEEEE